MRSRPASGVILLLAFAATACSKAGRPAAANGDVPTTGDAFRNEGDAGAVRAKALAGKSVLYGLDRLRRDLGADADSGAHPTALLGLTAPDVASEDLVAFYDRDLAPLALRGVAPKTCPDALQLLDDLTAPLKADYGRIVDALTGNTDTPRAYPGVTRAPAATDELSGLAYALAPFPSRDGFTLSGRIAAGVAGDLVRVEEEITADLDRDVLAPGGTDPWADPPVTPAPGGKVSVQWRTTLIVDTQRKTASYDVAITRTPSAGARSSFAATSGFAAAGDDAGVTTKARFDTTDADATGDQASAATEVAGKIAGEGAGARP
jgi:hypothetical protein